MLERFLASQGPTEEEMAAEEATAAPSQGAGRPPKGNKKENQATGGQKSKGASSGDPAK